LCEFTQQGCKGLVSYFLDQSGDGLLAQRLHLALTVVTRLQDRAESERKKKEVKRITKTPSRVL
jgi:hypothetical protein